MKIKQERIVLMLLGILLVSTNSSAASTQVNGVSVIHHQNKSSTVSSSTYGVPYEPSVAPLPMDPEHKKYIDSMDVPMSVKKLLYAYDMTPAGQAAFLRQANSSLVGPTGSSITTPTAYAADWGMVFAGITAANHWPTGSSSDASATVGMGFGDADRYAGLTIAALIDSVNVFDDTVAENGTFSAQLFHAFPYNWALAIGVANALPWGAFDDQSQSYYAVATKVFDTSFKSYSMPLTLSLGAGTGQFNSIEDAQSGEDSNVLPFGSVGWRILPQLSLVADWAANESNVGVSVIPIKTWPLLVTLAACNLNEHQDTDQFFLLSIAVGYNFLN